MCSLCLREEEREEERKSSPCSCDGKHKEASSLIWIYLIPVIYSASSFFLLPRIDMHAGKFSIFLLSESRNSHTVLMNSMFRGTNFVPCFFFFCFLSCLSLFCI